MLKLTIKISDNKLYFNDLLFCEFTTNKDCFEILLKIFRLLKENTEDQPQQ